MNRVKFLNKLDLKSQALNIANEHGADFKYFFGLNEANPELLTEVEKQTRDDYRNKLLGDKELKDKYELWHCIKCYQTKWRNQTPEALVKHRYRNCELIKGCYGK